MATSSRSGVVRSEAPCKRDARRLSSRREREPETMRRLLSQAA
jgi:hypothetical protein